jgi:hypothetical protein
MSFLTNMLFLNTATAGRIDSNNAIFRANQSRTNLAANSFGQNPANLLKAEQQITFTSLQNQLKSKIFTELEVNLQEKQKKDIAKQFDTFA